MKHNYLILIALFSFTFTQAQIINFPDSNLEFDLLYYNCADLDGDGIVDDDADLNDDGFIQVSEAESILGLRLDFFENLVDLTGLEYFTNLEMFTCSGNQILNLDVTAYPNLKVLEATDCNLTSIDVSQNPQLERLVCSFNLITELDLSNNQQLIFLESNNNQITSLDLINNTDLEQLSCQFNELSTLDLPDNSPLFEIYCQYNQLTDIDVTTSPDLQYLNLEFNSLTSLDLSNSMNLQAIWSSDNDFVSINIKNGVYDSYLGLPFNFIRTPTLEFICIDDIEEEYNRVQTIIENNSSIYLQYPVFNSYCSFVPGGEFYTLEGQSKLDMDADGCDLDDITFPNLRLSITDGTLSGTIISNESGAYTIPVFEGTHSIIPFLENPDYFTVSPESFIANFPSDTSPFIQDFCMTSNGEFNDLEIILIPRSQLRQGFDIDYTLIYKNNGTTTLSGTIDFNFDTPFFSLVSSVPNIDSESSGILNWNYSDLMPFESREILFSMHFNGPTTEVPPVDEGEIFNFTVNISPIVGDETESNNTFVLEQTVVNSFDPNDKTCLQGETITPEEVGKYVHYMIRFENTGTADAINIVVKDEIDVTKFDVSTLIPLNSSHDFVTRIKDDNSVEFIFEDVNLPFDDANNDGYLVFKIKTLETLVSGDVFANDAEIYFDFNAPIITNDEETTVAENLSIEESTILDIVKLYPNPVSNTLFIESKNTLESIAVFDVNGRQLQHIAIVGNKQNIELNFSAFSEGIYFVKIKTEIGIQTTKIIKK